MFSFSSFSQINLNVEFLSSISYDSDGNDIWGYVAPDSTEYAIFGTRNGVSIVNLADPRNPIEVDFIPQQGSIWRDMKTWGEYTYVVADQFGTTDGILVIDMSDLPNSISWENINPEVNGETLQRCHNIFIDEFGYAYLAGSNLNSGGILIYDVFSDPGNPIYVNSMPDVYSHDVYTRNNIVYSSEIYLGEFGAYDVSDKNNITQLGSQQTPFSFTHNTWLSDNSNVLFTTDELANAPVAAYDVSDLSNIKFLDEFRPRATIGQDVIPHNVHVWDDYLIISYYTDGCILVDASRPDNLIEVGNFDTYIPSSTGFQGAWGAYPFLPSGVILIGDIDNGLYILGPTYVRASFLEGSVKDKDSGLAINNATIRIEELEIDENTDPTGTYKTGTAIPGTYTITASAFGYETETIGSIELSSGNVAIVDFELQRKETVNVTVSLIESGTGNPIANGIVNIEKEDDIQILETNADGVAFIPSLFVGNYDIIAGKWGYKYNFLENESFTNASPNPTYTIELDKGYEDIFSLNLGWQESFSGNQGQWDRGTPKAAYLNGINIAPEFDSSLDPLNHAYVTGNTSNAEDGVLEGEAVLRSPIFDLTGYANPVISYDYWFWAASTSGNPVNQTLQIFITNGSEQKLVEQISSDAGVPNWESKTPFKVSDFLNPTSNMQIVALAVMTSFQTDYEAGFDNFLVEDSPDTGTKEVLSNIQIQSYPNPFSNEITIEIPDEFQDEKSYLNVYDSHGKLLVQNNIQARKQLQIGENLKPGVYILNIKSSDKLTKPLKIIKM